MTGRYFTPPKPRLYGHRGSSADFPENTLPAFAAALEAGMAYLELDVRATADGTVVVLHDETLLRTCGVDRPVHELSLAELRRLDAGATFSADGGQTYPFRGRGIVVPTLEELLNAFPDALFNIEIKQESPAIEDNTLQVIRAAGRADAVLLAAESDTVMARLRPLCPDIPTSFSYGELATFFAWLERGAPNGYRPPAAALQIPETYQGRQLVSPATLQAAHALGLEVHVWTVNEADDMTRLLHMGVDGLMSDRPALLTATASALSMGHS
jgi:glycerophosphoryl diester phosphodiesterase